MVKNNVTNTTSNDEFDFSNMKTTQAKDSSKAGTQGEKYLPGVLSIVYHKCGIRMAIPDNTYSELGYTSSLQFGFSKDSLIVASKLSDDQISYSVRVQEGKKTKKAIIYNAELVKEIIKEFELEFNGKSTITFHDIRYVMKGDVKVAIIKMK